jgi:hypothetical protein
MSEEQNQVEESPQLSEHDQEMLEVASQSEEQTNQELRSDNENLLLAGKYKDVAELEKAYTELQSKMGQESTEAQEDTPTEETPEVTDSVDEAQETVESKGIDFDGLNSEYSENGELSSETYTSLEQAGLSKEVVDSYIQGQEAIQQQQINALQSEVGGEAEYQSMIEWAASNLSESETEAFNATLDRQTILTEQKCNVSWRCRHSYSNTSKYNCLDSSLEGEDERYPLDPTYCCIN